MAGYFEEMNWRPLADGETPDFLLQLARLLQDMGVWEGLGMDQKLPPAASKEVVLNLKEQKYQEGTGDEQCPICLKQFVKDDIMKVLPCDHSFHPGCILPWLEKTNTCPLCRHELPTDDEVYESYRKEKVRAKQREEDLKNLHDSMFS